MSDQYNVLVVYKDREGANNIQRLLEDNLKVGIMMTWEESLETAEPKIPKYDLAVVSVDLHPRGQGLVGQRKAKPGLELLHRLREKSPTTPVVLVSVEDAQLIHEVQAVPNVVLAVEGVEFQRGLVEGARTLLLHNATPPEREDQWLDLEFSLTDGRDVKWTLKGVNFPYEDQGIITLEQGALDRLKEFSKLVEELVVNKSDWESQLKLLGQELASDIFTSNLGFNAARFNRVLGKLGGAHRLRIRFVVEEEVHPIALEALRDDAEQDYWMLEVPIVRRLNLPSDHYGLFQEESDKTRPLNCLIIDAFTPETMEQPLTDNRKLVLPPIPNARKEADSLWAALMQDSKQMHTGRIARICSDVTGKVRVVNAEQELGAWRETENQADSFVAALEVILTDAPPWDIVHYAGHSYYDRNGDVDRSSPKTGYVFFPSFAAEPIDRMGAETLAKYVRDTRMDAETFAKYLRDAGVKLLYLSSCHSSGVDFVFKMAEQCVPAIIGFRWDIDDKMAEEFTEAFYASLWDRLSLEDAFLAARKQLNKSHSKDPIWAAPMLVLQVRS